MGPVTSVPVMLKLLVGGLLIPKAGCCGRLVTASCSLIMCWFPLAISELGLAVEIESVTTALVMLKLLEELQWCQVVV